MLACASGVRRVVRIACCAGLLASTAAAQTARRVEIAATASLVVIDPVYLRPLAAIGSGPSTPTRAGLTLDVASPGITAAVYVGSRLQAIGGWSRTPARAADARLPPLPGVVCQPFACLALVVRTTEQRDRGIFGGAVDLGAGRRLRLAAGAALQVDHVTGTQAEGELISFHSVGGPITPRPFQAVTLTSPVLLGRLKVYPWQHLLVLVDATLRVGSVSTERKPFETSRITPTVGIGMGF